MRAMPRYAQQEKIPSGTFSKVVPQCADSHLNTAVQYYYGGAQFSCQQRSTLPFPFVLQKSEDVVVTLGTNS